MDYQQKEALRQKLTVGGVGVIAGAVAWWIVLASFLGWVSPTTAEQRTGDAVQAKVDKVLAPICADRFMANKAALVTFTKASEDYNRDEIVQKTVPKLVSRPWTTSFRIAARTPSRRGSRAPRARRRQLPRTRADPRPTRGRQATRGVRVAYFLSGGRRAMKLTALSDITSSPA